MGQGDAHIIECEMEDKNKNTIYEYAFVDIGTSSAKTEEVVGKFSDTIKKGPVTHVFLTHPDKDHISYAEMLQYYQIWLDDSCQKRGKKRQRDGDEVFR